MRWRECRACDVQWRDPDQRKTPCWSCGKDPDTPALVSAPRLTSQYGFARQLTDEEWASVRKDIGLD